MKGRELRRLLVERDGPLCHWCGCLTVDPLQVGDTADEAQTVDHLDTPKPRRSVRDPARAVVACSRCNRDRGCLAVDEWRAVLEVRKGPASRRSGGVGLYVGLAAAVIWWLPSILVAFVLLVAFHLDLWRLVRRARRLRLAGRLDETAVVLDLARARIAGQRRDRTDVASTLPNS